MPHILLGWELGMGLWHAHVLRRVGRELSRRGYTVTYVVANPVDTWPVLGGEDREVLQAPIATPRARPEGDDFTAKTFADILYEAGFYSVDALRPLVGCWDGLLHRVKPDLVICDHAPSLLVACHQRVPVVQLGLGFTQPPASLSPLPSLVPPHEGSENEALALASLQAVMRARGDEAPSTLASLYDTAASFVTTFTEFDPYRTMRKGPHVGPLEELPSPLPKGGDGSYFAYLSADVPASLEVLRSLGSSDRAGTVYLRGAHPKLASQVRGWGVNLLDKPAPMNDALRRSDVIIHHGGVGTSQQAAAAGRPQVLVPWHLEQAYNAAVLEGCGLAQRWRQGEACHEQIAALLASAGTLKKVDAFANLVAARRTPSGIETLARVCEDLLGMSPR
jgi:rhamnosyltransferase subunit B